MGNGMKYEELKKKITEVLQQPDSALVAIQPILEEIKADYETMLSLTDKVNQQDTRIRDLQDTNMKLFLSQTGQINDKETDDDEDIEGPDAIDSFINKLNKED